MTSHTTSIEPVVVIGAGVAGLAAAQRLKQAGITPLVLEARQRPGGRILTDRTYGPVELGAEFIHKNFKDDEALPDNVVVGKAMEFIGKLLKDDEIEKFDIAIGEGLESPTVRYAQYMSMMEMIEKGMPIPPNVLLDYSDLPETAKKQIEAYQAEAGARPPETAK